jgi:hypothetical protein
VSVVVSTTEQWPKLRRFVAAVEPQLAALDGELVVCDGSGGGLPPGWTSRARLVTVRRPGASVFELRAAGVGAASGDVVALSEDHCVPDERWCAEHLAAHAALAEAEVVGGAVLNWSTAATTDWANFLMTFAEFLPPLSGKPARVPPIANLSLKRCAVAGLELRPGLLELDLLPRLVAGGRVAVSDGPRVVHVQSHGLVGTPLVHFHNGRSTTGLRGHRPTPSELAVELVRHAWHPLLLWREAVSEVRARPGLPRRAKRSLAVVLGLAVCHSAGEVVGLLAGPGRSPSRLE